MFGQCHKANRRRSQIQIWLLAPQFMLLTRLLCCFRKAQHCFWRKIWSPNSGSDVVLKIWNSIRFWSIGTILFRNWTHAVTLHLHMKWIFPHCIIVIVLNLCQELAHLTLEISQRNKYLIYRWNLVLN